jgi:SAM-dependent methyltransferase
MKTPRYWLGAVQDYYTRKLRAHGAVASGVDWNSTRSQFLRFEQLLKVTPPSGSVSLQDYGCGYGSLFHYLRRAKRRVRYEGFDVSPEMIEAARRTFRGVPNARFKVASRPGRVTDYTVASGIFNVRLEAPEKTWKNHVLTTIGRMDASSRKGFAFNCLTKYSDKPKMRRHLYYADPLFLFDLCKRKYSRNVALLHDYGLYEFTILVRKDV